MKLRSVGIVAKPRKEILERILPPLLDWLHERNIQAIFDNRTVETLDSPAREALRSDFVDRREIPDRCDLILVLGGDGTLLATARQTLGKQIPILAVNLGSLGFLTAVTIDQLHSTLELILKDQHKVESRKMLQIELIRGGENLYQYHALNDAVLNKVTIARILDFEAYVDGEFLSAFKSDGLIVATPTGSTAYSLAAGGPIVHPSVDAFVFTPICPHTLTNRPLVVSDTSKIEIVLPNETESVFLTVDGQVGEELRSGDRIVCSLSPHRVNLVYPPNSRFFGVLRNKLKWGER